MVSSIDITFTVIRDDGGQAGRQQFTVPVTPGMTILDGLLYIQKELDPTLAWRFSCRMGICGSCGMVINGMPGLACNTQILSISGSAIEVAPLANFPVIRDLAVSLDSMRSKHRALKPYIIVEQEIEPAVDSGEYQQSPEELLTFLQFTDCIKCGICMSACPTLALDDNFAGPMPLTAVQRYNADSRDEGFPQRKKALEQFSGLDHCHYAAECTRACPKGVDPAKAIQRLRRSLVADALHLRRQPAAAARLPAAQQVSDESFPQPPAFTVEGADRER